MILDQLQEKYRELSIPRRIAVLALVGILPGSCSLLEDGQAINDDLENAIMTRASAEQKFQKAREQKANLPKLEEKIAFTEGELTKASKQLPDQFVIETILQKTAMIAHDTGVELRLFDPGKDAPAGNVFKFVEMPIAVQIFGTYSKIATFFDRIVHLDLLIHIKDIALTLSELEPDDGNTTRIPTNNSQDPAGKARMQAKARENSRVLANAKLLIFRTLTRSEEAAISAVANKNKAEKT